LLQKDVANGSSALETAQSEGMRRCGFSPLFNNCRWITYLCLFPTFLSV